MTTLDMFELDSIEAASLTQPDDGHPSELCFPDDMHLDGNLDVPPAQITVIDLDPAVKMATTRPTTTLSSQQEECIKTVVPLIKAASPQPLTYVAGYAGTGKSTILPFLLEQTGIPPEQIAFMAPTGKAAKVMGEKLRAQGYPNPICTTIHSAIYRAKPAPIASLESEIAEHESRANERVFAAGEGGRQALKASHEFQQLLKAIQRLKAELSNAYREDKINFQLNVDSMVQHARLIVTDEASMVGRRMAEDLMFFGVPILALGDPGQLPPVQDEEGLTSGVPNYFLDQIHRQAEGNPILHLATLARQGKEIELGDYGDGVRVMQRHGSKGYVHDMDAPDQPQLICGLNKTRWKITRGFRDGMAPGPVMGEPLIVCKNNKQHPKLVNGMFCTAMTNGDVEDGRTTFPLGIEDEDGVRFDINAFQGLFEEAYRGKGNFSGPESAVYRARKNAVELDWAYAITAHKSQGSQWDDVVVYDESPSFRDDCDRWLYTAITRAAKTLTLVV